MVLLSSFCAFENCNSAATFMLTKLWTRFTLTKILGSKSYLQLRDETFLSWRRCHKYLSRLFRTTIQWIICLWFIVMESKNISYLFVFFDSTGDNIFISSCKTLIINVTLNKTTNNFFVSRIGKIWMHALFQYEFAFGLPLHKTHITKHSI